MLIEFRVENHRSLRDEQALTLEAGRIGDETDVRPRELGGYGEKLLPAAVLYGANASGKSNVLSALAFMREAVTASHRVWESESGIPRTPFAWGPQRNEPSMFEVSVLLEGTKYVYGFVVSDAAVEEEWLYTWPKNRKQIWLERDKQNFKFGEHLAGPNDVMREVTRPNSLFLSVASQHQHPQLSSIYAWFRRIQFVSLANRRSPSPVDMARYEQILRVNRSSGQQSLFPEIDAADPLNDRIRNWIRECDTGIVDFKVVGDENPPNQRLRWKNRLLVKHQADDENSWLEMNDESQGTQTLFRMAFPIFDSLERGGLLLVDELEASLHPLLGLAIVRLFNSPQTNPTHAQLLFTTHDTNLLGTTLGEPPLRRDQIWFTEKDKEGASRLYPLTDYKPRRVENLERGYLQGRYGAIPFLGDSAWIAE